MFVDNLWLDGHLLLLKDRLANPLLVVLELLLLVLGLVAGVMVHMFSMYRGISMICSSSMRISLGSQ